MTAQRVPNEESLPWPEPAWLFKRSFCFLLAFGSLAGVYLAIVFDAPWPVTGSLCAVLIFDAFAYIGGATAEQWVRMAQAVSALRAGINLGAAGPVSVPATPPHPGVSRPPSPKQGGGE